MMLKKLHVHFSDIKKTVFLHGLKYLQDGMVFKPTKTAVGKINPLRHPLAYKAYALEGVEPISLTTSDNIRITAWYKPPEKTKPLFLYCHGNTGNLGDCGPWRNELGDTFHNDRSYRLATLEEMIKDGRGLLALTYRGYGHGSEQKSNFASHGKPSEEGIHKDVCAIWKFLTEEKKLSREHIFPVGDSLGGAVLLKWAAEYNPASVTTIVTFASIADKAHDLYPRIPRKTFIPFLRHNFNNRTYVTQLKDTKLKLLHGLRDRTTYPYHSRVLHDLAESAGVDVHLREISDAGHVNIHPKIIVETALM